VGDRERMPRGVMRRVPESLCENTSCDDPILRFVSSTRSLGTRRAAYHTAGVASINTQIIAHTSNSIVHTFRYGAR
jgi:hypothetical protein